MKFNLKLNREKNRKNLELGINIGAGTIFFIVFVIVLMAFPDKISYLLKFFGLYVSMLS